MKTEKKEYQCFFNRSCKYYLKMDGKQFYTQLLFFILLKLQVLDDFCLVKDKYFKFVLRNCHFDYFH